MTHNSVVGSLCFEIWFRRRKSEDTYTLKATSMEGKKAWTTDLERILWDQAAHSRGDYIHVTMSSVFIVIVTQMECVFGSFLPQVGKYLISITFLVQF